ncbi:MAG: hypothetical protein AB1758_35135, partial [Candidatus Eremiobacterota bacterium]
MPTDRKDLITSLADAGLVYPQAIRAVLADPRYANMSLAQALVEGKLIGEAELARFMADLFHIEYVSLQAGDVRPELLRLLPLQVMEGWAVVPYRKEGDLLTVAMADPLDVATEDIVRGLTHGLRLAKVVATRSDIMQILRSPKLGISQAIEGFVSHVAPGDVEFFARSDEELDKPAEGEYREHDAPIVELVAAIIVDAIQLKASDIHVEPQEESLRIRYRIDGV